MRAFLILIVMSLCIVGRSQVNNPDLQKLNDQAFVAYENNSDSTLTIAEQFSAAASGSNSLFEINSQTLLGILNKERGYYVSALNNYLKALNVARKIGDTGRESACLNNIGSLYQLQDNFERAKSYFLKSLNLEDSLNQPLQKYIRYYNLGDVYKEQDSLEIALVYFNNSLRIEQQLQNNEGIIYALLGIAEVYSKLDRMTDSKIELEKVHDMLSLNKGEEHILFHYLNGKVMHATEELGLAMKELNTALDISKTQSIKIHIGKILLEKIKVLKKLNDFQALSEAYDAYILLSNDLNSTTIKNQLEDLTYQNEISKKELELALIKEERDLAIENQKLKDEITSYSARIIWFLVAAIIAIFLFVFMGIKRLSKND